MAVWIVAGVALVAALAALARIRRLTRKLDALNQSYWELRYDYTRLRSELARLTPGEEPSDPEPPSPASVSFVPLSAIRKKDR